MIEAARDARGVVHVEFLVAFVPLFVVFLGSVQLALLGGARLIVQHAATRAARAAIVVIEDDPARYGGAPRRHLAGGSRAPRPTSGLGERLGADRVHRGARFGTPRRDGARMEAIRRAAHLPLAALVPDPRTFSRRVTGAHDNLEDAVGGSAALALGYGLAIHLPLTTAVTFPSTPGGNDLLGPVLPERELVTVRITHLFHCAVPIAAQLVCSRMATPRLQPVARGLGLRSVRGAALAELQHAPLARGHALLAASSARFAALRAEATMPVQRAAYRFANEQAQRSRP